MRRRSLLARVEETFFAGEAAPIPANFQEGKESLLGRLLEAKRIDRTKLRDFLAAECDCPVLESATPTPEAAAESVFAKELLREYEAFPLDPLGKSVAWVWPHAIECIDDLSFRAGRQVECYVTARPLPPDDTGREDATDDQTLMDTLVRELSGAQEEVHVIPSYDLHQEALEGVDDAPIIRLLNQIIAQAYRQKASDIHFEAEEHSSRVRYRIDGILREVQKIPKKLHNPMVSRIKIMSELDIAEKRVPQDGRTKLKLGEGRIDVRVSTIPSVFGEKVVMRILNPGALISVEELGFTHEQEERYRSIITRPYGIVLVTGPTGSGKTTTLYATLKFLNSKAKNIITIEDPVEYQIENVSQIQVNRRAGIDFVSGLKSVLRQDPDIIMIGEMRDEETASIAVKAALTGHLVLSTLHTNDAPGSYSRLCDMKIAPYLLVSSISGVVAQRLVRKICTKCRHEVEPDPNELELIGLEPAPGQVFFEGKGCSECGGTGYRGRSGIYEILTPTSQLKRMIMSGTLHEGSEITGFEPMVAHGRQKVLDGTTSVNELCQIVRHHSTA